MARQISCGHCGLTHGSVAEVRACSSSGHPQGSPRQAEAEPRVPSPALESSKPELDDYTAERLAGPDLLGRSLVVRPGADIPAPWSGVPEREASLDASTETVAALERAWRERERIVIRWSGDYAGAQAVLDQPFYQLSPAEELPGERAWFFAFANAVSLLGPSPSFPPLQAALTIDPAAASDEPGELTTGSRGSGEGEAAFADGGPLDLSLPARLAAAGLLPVVPRVQIEAGSLKPLTDPGAPTADLAPDQLAAVAHEAGPARILAPAGSGKTRVLTERTRHLVAAANLAPSAVSLVAYNRRAKDEMRERLADVDALDIRTVNSLALAIATGRRPFQSATGARTPTTIDERDARRLLGDLIPGKRRRQLTDPLEPWIDALSACRLGLRGPEEIEASYGGDVAGFPQVLEAYRSELARKNLVDFDEQILTALQRLLTDPQARAAARRAAPVLLIDEFQDLTPAHLLLLRILAGPAAEIFAVGDDDQTIYGYAGASPRWLVEFNSFFPGAVDHRLRINYRCPPDVIEGAVNLLSHNQHRVAKEISAPPSKKQDPGLHRLSGDPQQHLIDRVSALLEGGARPGDIAILARVNAALMAPALFLSSLGVATQRPFGLDHSMLERSGVAAALAWLRLATAPGSSLRSDDIRLALRRPPRSLHPRVADWACEQSSVKELRALANRLNTEKEALAIGGFADDIATVRSLAERSDTTAVLDCIYHEIGLLSAASQLDRSQRTARRAAHADELYALAAVAPLETDPASFPSWLPQAIDQLPPPGPADDAVTLATVHTTKGLEWEHVIVHDVRDDLYPHRLASDIEEERRVFHVAVTRGKQSVALTLSGPVSRFVAELAEPRSTEAPWPTEPVVSAGSPTASPAKAPRERPEPSSALAAAIRAELTDWRRERSKTDGVPAYVVLGNKTLDAIAEQAPDGLIALGQISGIGPAKLDRYGDEILGIVAAAEG